MKLARLAALLSVAALAAPSLAQEAPPGPGKDAGDAPAAKPADPAPESPKSEAPKKERKVDPKAVEALEGYAKQLHTPRSMGAKKLESKGEVATPMFPDPITFSAAWSAEKGLDLDVALPDSLLQMIPPEMLDTVRGMAKQQLLTVVRPIFGGAGEGLDAYDLAYKPADGGGGKVSMKPFADGAPMDSMSYVIGKDGLATRWTFAPHVDPSNPMAAQMAGMEYEVEMKYELRGNRNVFSSLTISDPVTGEMPIKPEYFEVTGGYLPKSLEVQGMQGTQTIRFYDYVADGKAVEGTAKPKPATTPAEKPAEAPKPATPSAPPGEGTGAGTPAK